MTDRLTATSATGPRTLCRVLCSLLAACGLAVAAAPAALAQGRVSPPIQRPLVLPAGCPLFEPFGGYQPITNVAGVHVADDMRTDVARGEHDVPFRIYYPNAGGPYPVVFWNHGGGTTEVVERLGDKKVTAGQKTSDCRAINLARIGFVVFVVGRLPVNRPSLPELANCRLAGWLSADTCRRQLGHLVHGPQNIEFLLRTLPATLTLLPNANTTIDYGRVVVGGWSGGSTAVLNIAGATQRVRDFVIPPTAMPQVTAFMADSPKGPVWGGFESVGFQEDAFFSLDTRPMLFFTGRSDYGEASSGHEPLSRTMAWLSAQRGSKFISWTRVAEADGGPVHGTMDLGNCRTASRMDFCQMNLSLTAAYLDAVVRNDANARNWLASDAYRSLSGGALELHRR